MNKIEVNPWICLFEYFFGPFSFVDNCRVFRAFTGVSLQVAECIFERYKHTQYLPDRSTLLMLLHYLKVYPTEDNGRLLFNIKTRYTYRHRLWKVINYLDGVMNEIDLDKRFEGPIAEDGIFKDVAMVIDATEFPIERPSKSKSERQVYFSGRKKENARSKYNLKYTFGVQIGTGHIVFMDGPDPGSKTDVRALRESLLMSELIDSNPDEVVLADKGYEGMANVLTPFKNPTPDEDAFNQILASVRQVVECTFRRLKIFGILGERGRFRKGCVTVPMHQRIVNICAQITNISFESEPLWFGSNLYLF